MQYRRVGTSGLSVSQLGLGTMGFGSSVDELDAEEQLRVFLEAGGTLVDTAPIYGDGQTEPMLGALLGKLGTRNDLVLSGKAGLAYRGGAVVRDASRRTLLDQLDQTLRDLGTDHLDLWQVHRWDEATPLDETLATLDFALATGRARYVGVSNFYGWQLATAAAAPGPRLVSNQVEYSLLRRDIEDEVIPAAEHHGIGIVAWAPLARGVLTGKYRTGVPGDSRAADNRWEGYVRPYLSANRAHIVEAVAKAADGLEVTMSHVALAWLLRRDIVASVLVGARTIAQLSESLATEDVEVPDEIIRALDDVSASDDWED
jgi:aryl-alcohol dehydrogenase-like predicted oxidoreductase